MDDETRAAFARIDRYFELSHLQAEELRGEVRGLGERIGSLEARVGLLVGRVSLIEAGVGGFEDRFISVDEQLRTLRRENGLLQERLTEVRDQTVRQGERLERVESSITELHARIDGFAGDVRQRFRVLTERLGSAA